MKITVQIVIDAQDGTPPAVEQVAAIARDDLTMATAGLALAEAHEVLSGIQHRLVAAQTGAAAVAGRHCGSCGRARARKDTRRIVLRTLFGTLQLESFRVRRERHTVLKSGVPAAVFTGHEEEGAGHGGSDDRGRSAQGLAYGGGDQRGGGAAG